MTNDAPLSWKINSQVMGSSISTHISPWTTTEYRISSPQALATMKCLRTKLDEEGRYYRHKRERERAEGRERGCRRRHVDELPRVLTDFYPPPPPPPPQGYWITQRGGRDWILVPFPPQGTAAPAPSQLQLPAPAQFQQPAQQAQQSFFPPPHQPQQPFPPQQQPQFPPPPQHFPQHQHPHHYPSDDIYDDDEAFPPPRPPRRPPRGPRGPRQAEGFGYGFEEEEEGEEGGFGGRGFPRRQRPRRRGGGGFMQRGDDGMGMEEGGEGEEGMGMGGRRR